MSTATKRSGITFAAAALAVAVSSSDALDTVSGGLPDGGGVDELASALAAPLLCGVALWLAIAAAAGVAALVPGAVGRTAARLHRRLLPRLIRALLAGGTGAGILLAPIVADAAPAHQSETSQTTKPPVWPIDAPPATNGSSTPRPASPPTATPAWPVTTSPTGPSSSPGPVSRSGTASTDPAPPADRPGCTVAAGQSLWSIAAHRLGSSATPREVAGYWPDIYSANRDVIGDDPSLIRPGQVLTMPAPTPQEQP